MIDNAVKSPPSTIASFEGMAIIVHTSKDDEPHIVVEIGTEKFTVSLWTDDRISSNSPEALAAFKKIARWFKMEVPGTGNPPRRVWNLIYDQWLRGRNCKPTEHVPTPDEITGIYRKQLIRITPKKRPRKIYDYDIKSIVPLPQYRLKVYFKRGEVRIVDIKDMCGDACWIQGAYQNFDQVKVCGGAWWKVGDYSEGIEDQDLWGAGDLVNPLKDHESQIPPAQVRRNRASRKIDRDYRDPARIHIPVSISTLKRSRWFDAKRSPSFMAWASIGMPSYPRPARNPRTYSSANRWL